MLGCMKLGKQVGLHDMSPIHSYIPKIWCMHVRVTYPLKGTLTHTIHGTGIESHDMNML